MRADGVFLVCMNTWFTSIFNSASVSCLVSQTDA